MAVIIRAFLFMLLFGILRSANSQEVPKDLKSKIDGIISAAHKTAVEQFPCKIGTGGKLKMMRWQKVDSCLNDAAGRVDWQGISKQLEDLAADAARVSKNNFAAAVEESLNAHALPFNQVFVVKNDKALLPLTNSVLHFLPADSLHDLPVYDRSGKEVGRFSGIYSFERSGGLASANTYRLTLFQYTDDRDNVQSPPDKLLLDAYGVPWKAATTQLGFRLPIDKIVLKR